MKLTPDSLTAHLSRQLLPAYLVSGDEPLLVSEAADAIRQKARGSGYTERQVFFAERGFDWDGLQTEGQSMSLFAERRIFEIKLPSGKAGDGAATLQGLVSKPSPDNLLLVVSAKLDRTQQNMAWVKAFEQQGGWVQVWPVDAGRLPAWISTRMKRAGLEPTADAAALLAERVEGNLLAAQQEIDKLVLLVPPGRVDADTLAQVVANSARYDVFQLADAATAGDPERALRILQGLRSEGVEPTLILWSLCRSIRSVWRELSPGGGSAAPQPYWQKQGASLAAAAKRLSKRAILGLIRDAARTDRTIKGRWHGDPWDALAMLVARFSGAKL